PFGTELTAARGGPSARGMSAVVSPTPEPFGTFPAACGAPPPQVGGAERRGAPRALTPVARVFGGSVSVGTVVAAAGCGTPGPPGAPPPLVVSRSTTPRPPARATSVAAVRGPSPMPARFALVAPAPGVPMTPSVPMMRPVAHAAPVATYGPPRPTYGPPAPAYGVPAALAAGPPCGTGKGELEGGPPQFTAGLPDPAAIESQKTVYTHELDDQLKQGVEVLAEQLKQQSAYLAAVGEQQKRQYGLQVDRDIKAKEMVLAQQHNEQLLMLQQAAQQQKSALEHQANALILEYQQKKTAEELAAQQFNFQKQHMEMQARYAEEMRELQVQQMAAASQVAAQQAAIAQEAAAAERQAQSMAHHHSTAMLHGARGGVPFAVPMVVGPPPVLACAGHSRIGAPRCSRPRCTRPPLLLGRPWRLVGRRWWCRRPWRRRRPSGGEAAAPFRSPPAPQPWSRPSGGGRSHRVLAVVDGVASATRRERAYGRGGSSDGLRAHLCLPRPGRAELARVPGGACNLLHSPAN
ncbi:unnamed protein product, partial [Prorocentrum cordatum]